MRKSGVSSGYKPLKNQFGKLSSGILSVYGFRKASIIIPFSCPLARECFFHFPNQPSYKKQSEKDDVQQTMKWGFRRLVMFFNHSFIALFGFMRLIFLRGYIMVRMEVKILASRILRVLLPFLSLYCRGIIYYSDIVLLNWVFSL